MGRRYLNREEKNEALTIAGFIAFLDDCIISWTGLKRGTDQVKYAKMAKTFAGKALAAMFTGLAPEEIQKLHTDNKKMTIITKYNAEAVAEYEAIKKMDSITPVETDDLIALTELALASCSICEAVGDDADSCRFKVIFHKYNMQPLNLEAGTGVCPYRIAEGGGGNA